MLYKEMTCWSAILVLKSLQSTNIWSTKKAWMLIFLTSVSGASFKPNNVVLSHINKEHLIVIKFRVFFSVGFLDADEPLLERRVVNIGLYDLLLVCMK